MARINSIVEALAYLLRDCCVKDESVRVRINRGENAYFDLLLLSQIRLSEVIGSVLNGLEDPASEISLVTNTGEFLFRDDLVEIFDKNFSPAPSFACRGLIQGYSVTIRDFDSVRSGFITRTFASGSEFRFKDLATGKEESLTMADRRNIFITEHCFRSHERMEILSRKARANHYFL